VFIAEGVPLPARREDLPSAAMTPATPDYFKTMGIPLVRGRLFTAADNTEHAAPVVVINETMARRLWPGANPVGRRFKQGWPETPSAWREIVGVVRDIRVSGLTEPNPMQVYMPYGQETPRDFAIVVRTAADTGGIAASLESAIHALAPDVPVYDTRRMTDVVGSSMARERMAGLVLGVFALVALTLAAVGLYGLVAQGVIERRHEIGVRIALGATTRQVVRLVVAGGLWMSVIGAAIGIAGALAMAKGLEGLLFGVAPRDPSTLALVVLALLLVAAAACILPAIRATRVAPSEALRA
jgi:putative ABC transport system permease protein